jgi:phospholipid/cholesterol/gamma-HCH transport system substrate-binding protein
MSASGHGTRGASDLPSGRGDASELRPGRGPGSNGAAHDGGRGIRDQIARYRGSFIAVLSMIVIAAAVGGYVLANERLSLPSWFPVLGHEHFTLKAYFSSAQALAPGQGQEVTIAGAKIGEVSSVELRNGRALVSMELTPKYARVYHDATLLMRPKTSLNDMTIEVEPGNPSTGRLESGAVIPISQTSPNVNFDQFLASLDTETRAYLQELLAAAAEGLHGNGANLSAAFKRFDPLARNSEEITAELQRYHTNIAGSIHNFTILMQALAGVEKEIAELVESSNRVFRVFASQNHAVQRTLQLLPGALSKTQSGLGRLATAAHVLGPTLTALHPFAAALAPAQEASQPFLRETTPIIANEIRPFTREASPVVAKLKPALSTFAQALPGLTTSFSILNELVNELGYNPGPNQGGFIFFADWLSHNFNSIYSIADSHGALGNTLAYSNCGLLSVLEPAARADPAVKLLIGLFNFPHPKECPPLAGSGATAASVARAASVASAASAGETRRSATTSAAHDARRTRTGPLTRHARRAHAERQSAEGGR